MMSTRAKPQSVAIENVVFVEFRAPTKVREGQYDYLVRSAAELAQAVSSYTATIMETRDLVQALRATLTLGAVQMKEGADPAAELLLGLGSEDLSQAQHRA